MRLRLVRLHPAMFLGEQRDDFERVFAVDEETCSINPSTGTIDLNSGVKYKIKVRGDENDNGCSETLIPYPNNIEFDILNERVI